MGKEKDWTGNYKSIYICLGASNHALGEREANDYYATDPVAAEWLLKLEPDLMNIWEPCVGEGHLAKVFEKAGKLGKASDLIDRGYGEGGIDFLKCVDIWDGDIVTNPPYSKALECTYKALELVPEGRKVCMFLKLTFLESQSRAKLFQEFPFKVLYVSSARLNCAKSGNFDRYSSSAAAYGWFVWEKGFKGDPIIKWFNTGMDAVSGYCERGLF